MNEQELIDYFQLHPNDFISGEQLSMKFKCSRTAIWKQIQRLKRQGYQFEAISRVGYRLMSQPERLTFHGLTAKIKTKVMGRQLRLMDKTESTQTAAHHWVEEGAEEGALIIAEQQTSGRGRMGRHWHSPPGKGVWMSLILKPRIPIHFAPQLTLLTAVALCRTINKIGIAAGIKWPNDLLVAGKKICGILLESNAEDERLKYVIAGIGISANLQEEDYPEELRMKATSLFIESGKPVSREQLIADFLLEFECLYEIFQQEGFAPIRTLWEALSVSLNRHIRIQTLQGWVEGTASGIDSMGALQLIKSDGSMVKMYSGDIELSV